MLTWSDTHRWERFCKSPGFLGWKFQHVIGAKNKKKSCLVTVEMVSGIFPVPPSPEATLHRAEISGSCNFSCEKKGEHTVLSYPTSVGCCWRNSFLSSRTQSTKAEVPWLRGGRRLGKSQWISKCIKVTWFLLTVLRTFAGSPPRRLWEYLSWRSPQQVCRHP